MGYYFKTVVPLVLIALIGCGDSIDSKNKRNLDWVWSEDESGNNGKWIPIGNENNVQNGYVTSFYGNGNTYKKAKVINNNSVDTTWYYDFNQNNMLIKVYINDAGDESWLFPINGLYKSHYQSGELHEEGFISKFSKGYFWNVYAKDGSIIYREVNDTLLNKSSISNYYPNGKIKDTCITINNLLEETSMTWFENGQLKLSESWNNGKRNGEIKSFYPNGQLETVSFAKKGLKDSTFLTYYKSGTLKTKCTYNNGVINGHLKKYYSNGQIENLITFDQGKQEGPLFKFYETGEKYFEGQLTEGKVSGTWFYSDGKIFSTCVYEGNDNQGIVTYYTKSQEPFVIEKIENGLITETDTLFDFQLVGEEREKFNNRRES